MSDTTSVRTEFEESIPSATATESLGGVTVVVSEPDEDAGAFYGAVRRTGVDDETRSRRINNELVARIDI